MRTTIRYILLTAVRDWLFVALVAALMVAVGAAKFLGHLSMIEQQEAALVYAAGASRVILVIGMILFVCFHVRRMFDTREVEVILSRPVSRTSFVLSYYIGFVVVASLVLLPLSGLLAIMGGVNWLGLLVWALSLWLELLLVIAFACFAALMLQSSVVAVLFCFAFYLTTRMMGFFLYMLERPYTIDSVDSGLFMKHALVVISAIMPRVDLFSQTGWLVNGWQMHSLQNWLWLPQALIFIPLVLAMAVWDFSRREF